MVRRRRRSLSAALILSLFSINTYGFEWSETFSSSTRWDLSNSTLVLNKSLERVHSSLQVDGWNNGSGSSSTAFSVGDGRDGEFKLERYSEFGTVSGTTITINTDIKTELRVTNFILNSGYTLRPIGSQPLIIRSLKDVQISGIIDCNGGEGGVATVTEAGSGGTGRCGGGAGGAGSATVNIQAGTGVSGGTGISGGVGANTSAGAGDSGGGGGGYSLAVAPSIAEDGAGGTPHGTHAPNDTFSNVGGGSGGGGGGAGTTSKGGGGGGGGGAIYIYAVRSILVDATGEIRADGGNGRGPSSGNGGSGGGGAGGSILMFAGNIIDFYGAGAPYRITAHKGVTPDVGGTTGDGGTGRSWSVDANDAGTDGFPNGGIDDPQSNLFPIGKVKFLTTPQTLTSYIIDLGNTKPTPLTLNLESSLPSSSTATVEVRGSHDAATFTSWLSSSQITSLDGYRYLQFRINLTNNSTYNYSYVDSLTMTYTGFQQNQFDMVGACGRIGNSPTHFLTFSILIISFYIFMRLYHSKPMSKRT